MIPVGRHSMHTCRTCGGLWVGRGTFQSICAKKEEQEAVLGFQPEASGEPSVQDNKPKRVYIPCPECRKLMNHKNFSGSGIVLDWCRNHGSWCDRSELQRIVRFIGDGGLRKAREREKLKLKEQESRLRMQEFSIASLERRLNSNPGKKLDNGIAGDSLADFLSRMFQ
jgi:Zn-finger nucleic acid-binding protein